MRETGRYIGTPSGIVLCVDGNGADGCKGRMFHAYNECAIPFDGYEQLIQEAEAFFNALGFPSPGTLDRDIRGNTRRHPKKEGMTREMSEERLLQQHGDLGTFVIRVQQRQHSSWQGRVTYLDENKTVAFRSVLELLKIIDGVLDENQPPADDTLSATADNLKGGTGE